MPILYFILNNVCLPKQNRNITKKCILKGTASKYNLTCRFLKTGVNIKGFSLWNNNSRPSWGEYLALGRCFQKHSSQNGKVKLLLKYSTEHQACALLNLLKYRSPATVSVKIPLGCELQPVSTVSTWKTLSFFTTVNTTTFTSLSGQMAPVHKYTS